MKVVARRTGNSNGRNIRPGCGRFVGGELVSRMSARWAMVKWTVVRCLGREFKIGETNDVVARVRLMRSATGHVTCRSGMGETSDRHRRSTSAFRPAL